MSGLSFHLPDLSNFNHNLRAFLRKKLIDLSTLNSLEQVGRLNWWVDIGACQRLLPMLTPGDGNCLLHSASLGMWGYYDRNLLLRTLLSNYIQSCPINCSVFRRWRWQQMQANKQSGLVLSEEEWNAEWEYLLRQASPEPRMDNNNRKHSQKVGSKNAAYNLLETSEFVVSSHEDARYHSLEELHVYILANILRRPIIIVADTILRDADGDAFAPIPFGGIYLPLESEPEDCHHTPLMFTYDAAHFSALVTCVEGSGDASGLHRAIPLVDPDLCLLPIHFLVDPGKKFKWRKPSLENKQAVKNLKKTNDEKLQLLKSYLEVVNVPMPFRYSSDSGVGLSENEDSFLRSFCRRLKQPSSPNSSINNEQMSFEKLLGSTCKKNSMLDRRVPDSRSVTEKSRVVKQMFKFFDDRCSLSTKRKNIKRLNRSGSSKRSSQALGEVSVPHGRQSILAAKLRVVTDEFHEKIIANHLQHAQEQERYCDELGAASVQLYRTDSNVAPRLGWNAVAKNSSPAAAAELDSYLDDLIRASDKESFMEWAAAGIVMLDDLGVEDLEKVIGMAEESSDEEDIELEIKAAPDFHCQCCSAHYELETDFDTHMKNAHVRFSHGAFKFQPFSFLLSHGS